MKQLVLVAVTSALTCSLALPAFAARNSNGNSPEGSGPNAGVNNPVGSVKRSAPIAIDRLTCAQAVAYVEQNKRFYRNVEGALLPIYTIAPVSSVPSCAYAEKLWTYLERTTDDNACRVGYQCLSK